MLLSAVLWMVLLRLCAPYRNDASPSLVPQSSCASTSVVTSHGAGGVTGARAPHWPRKWTDNPRSSRLKGRAELTRVPLLKSTSCQIMQFLIAPHPLMRNHKFIGWSRTWYSSSHMKKKSHIYTQSRIYTQWPPQKPLFTCLLMQFRYHVRHSCGIMNTDTVQVMSFKSAQSNLDISFWLLSFTSAFIPHNWLFCIIMCKTLWMLICENPRRSTVFHYCVWKSQGNRRCQPVWRQQTNHSQNHSDHNFSPFCWLGVSSVWSFLLCICMILHIVLIRRGSWGRQSGIW